ncbi:chaperone modulator CbpM [Desulfoferrobacter suflitae]|uniref:chaperone modulator CbpM n=1 Tax=Desulfoferrobacter suflitae TaxID=2865782 RepID=UPI002164EA76|nr:chaperone modulator CbpM [Desulfoferrobacter suflitae]MCK8602117.1 chaperone modulator CbpM [Desulfoferrobacter suflitae]
MVEKRQYLMVRLRRTPGVAPYLNTTEVASRCGIHPELIERFVHLGLIDPSGHAGGEFIFRLEVVPLIRKIIRLRNHLGINYAGIGLVLELMTRIEELEEKLQELMGE